MYPRSFFGPSSFQEQALRSKYNQTIGSLEENMKNRRPVDAYENTVNYLTSTFGGGVSPQEIGDTAYNIYAKYGPAPGQKYYGGNTVRVEPRAGAVQGATAGEGYGGYTSGAGGTGGAVAAGPSPEELAAARSAIQERVAQANQIYNALFGDVNRLATERRGGLEKSFERQFDALADEELAGSENILRTYAGRGLTDSSYRQNAQADAGKEYERVRADVGDERASKLAELGQYVNTTTGGLRAGQDYLGRVTEGLGSVDDLNSLMSLRTSLDERIAQLGTDRAGLGTESDFIKSINKVAPATDRTQALRQRLTTIANAPTSPEEKSRIATGFINSSGLSDEEKRELMGFYSSLPAAVPQVA